jgi:hypothetical protein
MLIGCCGLSPCASAQSQQEIVFTGSVPWLGISLAMRADLTWDDVVDTRVGDEATVVYDLQPKSGTLTITIPLSEVPLIGLDDVVIELPLPSIPIGTLSIPATSVIPGFPSQLASVNVNLEGAMTACTACSSGSAMIDPAQSTLEWESWGAKTLAFVAQPYVGTSIVSAEFAYVLSVGISMTIVLIGDMTLLEPAPVSATIATGSIETVVETSEPSYTMYYVVGGIAAAVVVGALVVTFLRARA